MKVSFFKTSSKVSKVKIWIKICGQNGGERILSRCRCFLSLEQNVNFFFSKVANFSVLMGAPSIDLKDKRFSAEEE